MTLIRPSDLDFPGLVCVLEIVKWVEDYGMSYLLMKLVNIKRKSYWSVQVKLVDYFIQMLKTNLFPQHFYFDVINRNIREREKKEAAIFFLKM